MNVTIFGTGYVGLVTGACLAEVGHQVMCVDVDADKISKIRAGIIPIYEPGLTDLVLSNVAAGRLDFTCDPVAAVEFAKVQFIAVGTPPNEDGTADLQHVLAVGAQIAELMDSPKIVVTKSTVPVGTADKVTARMQRVLSERGEQIGFELVSNPEFLKEGSAVQDCLNPDRIVIGSRTPAAAELLAELYQPLLANGGRILFMDIRSAELAKYAANAMLATKISFINEIANLAERLGADVEQVRLATGADPRIGYQFINPGCGYGGSCFPKDVKAIVTSGEQAGYVPELLQAVERVNQRQKTKLFQYICDYFGGSAALKGRTIALWGLAFKPNTDDMREASSRDLMEALWQAGAKVRAYDPQAMAHTQAVYGADHPGLCLVGTKEACLQGADVLVVCTEWDEFKRPDLQLVKQTLLHPVVFDGRNLYDPAILNGAGLTYYGIGRGASVMRPVTTGVVALPEADLAPASNVA